MQTTAGEPELLTFGSIPSDARRTRLVAIALVAILLGATGGYLAGHRGTDKTAPPTGSISGIVDVTIGGLNVSTPSTLAALLYRGTPAQVRPGTDGAGGFTAPVSANVYRVTEVVRAGAPLYARVAVTRPIAHIAAGESTLWIFVAHHLVAYSGWVPGSEPGTQGVYGCKVQVAVDTSPTTAVHVRRFRRGRRAAPTVSSRDSRTAPLPKDERTRFDSRPVC